MKKTGRSLKTKSLVAIFSEETHCPSSNISNRVAGSFLSRYGGDSLEHLRLRSNASEEFGVGEIAIVVCHFEFSPSSSRLCMNAPGRN